MKFLISSKGIRLGEERGVPWRWLWPPKQLTESLEDPTEFCGLSVSGLEISGERLG